MTTQTSARRRWAPAGHWLLLGIVVVATATALLLQGFARHEVGGSATALVSTATPAVPGKGTVFFEADGQLRSRAVPAKTVALTFDDGPDPRWTPQVLTVLEREHVPATFFDIGARVADHPDLVRRELAAGDEVGVHTFTHVNLSTVPKWRQNLELSLSQVALSGATGRTSALMRPPYSSTREALTPADLNVIRGAAARGYLVALADRDSEDWRRPGWIKVLANATPRGHAGAIVMFHDGGGNRSQTVQALSHLIVDLKSRGYHFVTITGALGLPATAADQPTTKFAHLQGLAFVWAMRLSELFAVVVTWLLVPLGVLAALRTFVLMAFAHHHSRRAWRRINAEEHLPEVSVIVPAYNELVGIEATVRSLRASDYPQLEIVVVDDGSTDGTADLVESLQLDGVKVIRQPNQGKAVALNTGIAAATANVIVMVDGDTVFQPDTVRALVQPLQDPRVGAVSGNTKVGNRRRLLGRWQHLEYVIGFNLDRRMYDLVGCMPTVPGAIGAFRRSVLDEVGGVSVDTLAEDTDLTMAVNRAGFWVVYEERALAWTEAPSTLAALWRQRYRWCYGTMQSIWKHRGAVRDTGHGRRLGRVGLPYLLAFQVALPLLAPVVDIFAIYGLIFLNPLHVAAFWLLFVGLQLLAGGYALHLDRESMRPLWTLPLQQFVYRQLMYLVVIQSLVTAASGARLPWHKLARTGEAGAEIAAQSAATGRLSQPDNVG